MTSIDEMPAGREMDALIAERVFGLRPIAWRVCAPDPECGELQEMQSHDPEIQPGEDVYGYAKYELHPCYNRLDTDEPRTDGWTDEELADTKAHFYDNYWNVVPRYSTNIAAAWQIVDHFHSAEHWIDVLTRPHSEAAQRWRVDIDRIARARADSAPLAICRAALKYVEDRDTEGSGS